MRFFVLFYNSINSRFKIVVAVGYGNTVDLLVFCKGKAGVFCLHFPCVISHLFVRIGINGLHYVDSVFKIGESVLADSSLF